MKKLRYPLFALLGIFLVTYLMAWITGPSRPDMKRYVEKAAAYRVEVMRDSLGVPHIYGKTDADVAFGLGYAQSEDDFNTLHDVLLATRGLMASKYGYTAAKTDYVVNLMGVWDAVNTKYETDIPEGVRAIAEAYADGVNLYAAQHPGTWSYYLFPISGKDIIAGFTFKTPMFYGFDKAVGAMMAPREPEGMDTDGEVAFLWNAEEKAPLGSQGIAVAPSRTEDGHTRLLVNSHQPLEGPVSWYEVRLHSEEGWNMAGGTFPGAPVVIHGHNDKLGWANTVNKPDLVDFYELTLNPDDEDQYLLDGEWVDFEVKMADILVRFLGPVRWTFKKPIRHSVHGPVLETDHGWYALRWAGMEEVRTLEFLYKLNKAGDKEAFEDALAMNAMPSINYIYADHEGNIGHYYNAMFPKREEGFNWQEVLPGDRAQLVWKDYLSFEHMPKTLNPGSGFVYNANNTPFSATDGDDDARAENYPDFMGLEQQQTNRSMQIERMARQDSLIGADDFYAMKFDLRYHPEYAPVKRLLSWVATPDLDNMLDPVYREARSALRQWNLETGMENEAAALAILTLKPLLTAEEITDMQITQAFKSAVDLLYRHYDTTRVPLGEVQKLKRGDKELAVGGGPDILRAIYTDGINTEGKMIARAGDGFTMLVAWDSTGLKSSKAIHQYGAATNRENSRHYNDQMEMFTAQQLRDVPFEREALEKQVERRYHPADGEF